MRADHQHVVDACRWYKNIRHVIFILIHLLFMLKKYICVKFLGQGK